MSIPTDSTTAFGPLLQLERARLLEILHGLGPADWERPTPCPAWSVLGLCAHLLGDDVSSISRLRDGHHGTVPPEGVDGSGFIRWLDELQIEWVHAARRLSPRMVVELLRWTDEQLAHAVDALDGAAVTASVTWASDGPVPVWLDQGRELSERWIHRQQLLQALGRESDLRADLAVPVLDGLRWAYPFRLAALRRPVGTVVAVTVGGAGVQLHWVLVCTGDEWEFDVPARGPASAELTLTTEQAWRLLTNNLDELELRRLPASGDAEIVRTLLRTRAIIGEPDAPAAPGYAVMPPSTMNSDPVQ